ncbi:MAG: hypothetical protein JWM80_3392 [Cyanobacteria bacterium RYN_339]|nr:hypothetical protein [Cyanobacteria bacterium RYN_339]
MPISSFGAKLLAETAPKLREQVVKRGEKQTAGKIAGDLLKLDRKAIDGLGRDAVGLIKKFDAKLKASNPTELALKYKNMAISPRRFLTGQPELMMYDMRELAQNLGAQTVVQGDMHMHNIAVMRSYKGKLKIRPNDFDEATIGPAALDFNRLATHIVLTGREKKLGAKETQKLVEKFAASYHDTMSELAKHPGQKVHVEKPQAIKDLLKRAEGTDPLKWIEKRAPKAHGVRMLERDATRLDVSGTLKQQVIDAVDVYRGKLEPATKKSLQGYKVTDVVKVVQGTGSMGRPRYRVLLERGKDEPIILQLKAQEAAPLERLGLTKTTYRSEAERNLALSSLMDGNLDGFRGTTQTKGLPGDFLVERVRAEDDFLNVNEMSAKDLKQVSEFYGTVAAKGHAHGADAGLASAKDILATLGSKQAFVDGLVDFAHQYADQTERDYSGFMKALKQNAL